MGRQSQVVEMTKTIRLNHRVHFLLCVWTEECVVYVVDSGETHLLSAPCGHLLRLLQSGAQSFEMLMHTFRSHFDDVDSHEMPALLEEFIDRVCQIGLIETEETVS